MVAFALVKVAVVEVGVAVSPFLAFIAVEVSSIIISLSVVTFFLAILVALDFFHQL